MFSKWKFLLIFITLISIGMYYQFTDVQARTESDTIDPTKDTFISYGGALSEPTSNFGGAEQLDVGDGINGLSAAMIQFDLGSIEGFDSINIKLEFIVFGDNTRTLRFHVITGDWSELDYTAVDDPLNVTDLVYLEDEDANYTMQVTPSMDELDLSLSNHLDLSGKITLIISANLLDDGWLSIYSRESSFSLRHPELSYEYTVPDPTTQPGSSGDSGDGTIIGILFLLGLIGGIIIIINERRNSNKPKDQSDQNLVATVNQQDQKPVDTPKFCQNCGNAIAGKQYCQNCGTKQF